MVVLHNLRTIRLGYSISSSTLASKPTNSSLQSLLFYRQITSQISETQHDFTVNYLINSCGLSPESAISASKLVKFQTPNAADSVLALLRTHGLTQPQISKVVKGCPRVLVASLEETLLPKLRFFESIGVSRENIARTVASNPWLLAASLEKRILPVYKFLRSLISEKNVVAVFKRRSRVFVCDHCKNMVPNVALLRELGMPPSSISVLLAHYIHVVMHEHKMFGEVVREVEEMGFSVENSTFVFALHALCGKSSKLIWRRSRDAYVKWGWSEEDVLSAFRKNPEFMVVSEKKIMEVMEFLVNKMGWPSGIIAKSPWVMRHSLEKRIIPRCSVIKVLRLKGLVDGNLSLGYVMQPHEKRFVEKFVTRYQNEVPQLWNVYEGKAEIADL